MDGPQHCWEHTRESTHSHTQIYTLASTVSTISKQWNKIGTVITKNIIAILFSVGIQWIPTEVKYNKLKYGCNEEIMFFNVISDFYFFCKIH